MSSTEVVGLTLVLLSVLLLLLEVKAPGFGVLGVGGGLALIAGLLLLLGISGASLSVVVALAVPILLLVAFLAVIAHRARRNKVVTGQAGMVGLEGRAETDLLPEGKVIVRGELWDASAPVRLERGQAVKVVGVRGLRLDVVSARDGEGYGRPLLTNDEEPGAATETSAR
jgi:membrane-bound serine protease (ClpP class)